MWKKITELLALTNSERKVILFLIVTLSFGYGIRLMQEMFPSAPKFNYSSSDSSFSVLSMDKDNIYLDIEENKNGIKKININKATEEQLMTLPGIGKTTAKRIIEYRKEIGGYASIDELESVKGISKKKIERIKKMVSIE